MEVNETTRPLTEIPEENTPETSVPTVEMMEKRSILPNRPRKK